MRIQTRPIPGMLALAMFGAAALANSTVHPTNKFAWQENTGWTNWRDANGAAQGVRVHATFLSGWIWGENIGWITVGNGAPGLCNSYANTTGADAGVNILPSGDLTGYAWAENVGWINFDTRAALSAHGQQARYDAPNARFRGYAWGENIGWINLDHFTHFVGATQTGCPGDLTGDGVINFDDLGMVLGTFGQTGACLAGDANGDGVVNFDDLGMVLAGFGTDC